MIQEIIYTSAPRGLKAGSRGFCTVVSTPGMARNLADRLESLSAYRHAFGPQDPNARLNPVSYSHLLLRLGGQQYHVLSRICDAGLDYTQRTNKFAHHVVLDGADLPPCGPAEVLGVPGFMETTWDGEPRIVPPSRRLPQQDCTARVCTSWQAAAGDAGWGGVLAETALPDAARPAIIHFSPGVNTLALVSEALALLPPRLRWSVTFSTYCTNLPTGVDCQWKFVLAGSPEAKSARVNRSTLVINLAGKVGSVPESRLVDAARTGVAPRWEQPAASVGGPAPVRSKWPAPEPLLDEHSQGLEPLAGTELDDLLPQAARMSAAARGGYDLAPAGPPPLRSTSLLRRVRRGPPNKNSTGFFRSRLGISLLVLIALSGWLLAAWLAWDKFARETETPEPVPTKGGPVDPIPPVSRPTTSPPEPVSEPEGEPRDAPASPPDAAASDPAEHAVDPPSPSNPADPSDEHTMSEPITPPPTPQTPQGEADHPKPKTPSRPPYALPFAADINELPKEGVRGHIKLLTLGKDRTIALGVEPATNLYSKVTLTCEVEAAENTLLVQYNPASAGLIHLATIKYDNSNGAVTLQLEDNADSDAKAILRNSLLKVTDMHDGISYSCRVQLRKPLKLEPIPLHLDKNLQPLKIGIAHTSILGTTPLLMLNAWVSEQRPAALNNRNSIKVALESIGSQLVASLDTKGAGPQITFDIESRQLDDWNKDWPPPRHDATRKIDAPFKDQLGNVLERMTTIRNEKQAKQDKKEGDKSGNDNKTQNPPDADLGKLNEAIKDAKKFLETIDTQFSSKATDASKVTNLHFEISLDVGAAKPVVLATTAPPAHAEWVLSSAGNGAAPEVQP